MSVLCLFTILHLYNILVRYVCFSKIIYFWFHKNDIKDPKGTTRPSVPYQKSSQKHFCLGWDSNPLPGIFPVNSYDVNSNSIKNTA